MSYVTDSRITVDITTALWPATVTRLSDGTLQLIIRDGRHVLSVIMTSQQGARLHNEFTRVKEPT